LYPSDASRTNNKKRTLSETGDRQAPTVDGNANNEQIDPNLSSYARRGEAQVDAMSTNDRQESLENRRERIRRERDRLAAQVAAMNRELESMEEET
jgi:hypothetical protein